MLSLLHKLKENRCFPPILQDDETYSDKSLVQGYRVHKRQSKVKLTLTSMLFPLYTRGI